MYNVRLREIALVLIILAAARLVYTLATNYVTYDETLYMSAGMFTWQRGFLTFTYSERQVFQLMLMPFGFNSQLQIIWGVSLSCLYSIISLYLMKSTANRLGYEIKYRWIFLLAPAFLLQSVTILTEGFAFLMFMITIRLLISKYNYLSIFSAVVAYNSKEPYGVLLVALPIFFMYSKDLFNYLLSGAISTFVLYSDFIVRTGGISFHGTILECTGEFAGKSLACNVPDYYGVFRFNSIYFPITAAEISIMLIFLGLGMSLTYWFYENPVIDMNNRIIKLITLTSVTMILGMGVYTASFEFYQVTSIFNYLLIILRFGTVALPLLYASLMKHGSTNNPN